MQLISFDDIRTYVETQLDEWVVEHADVFREASHTGIMDSEAKSSLDAFLTKFTTFAILSHRWSKDEMTILDLNKLHRISKNGISSFIQQQMHAEVRLTTTETIDKLVELSSGNVPLPEDPPLLSQLAVLLPHIPHCTGFVKLINFCILAQNSYQCNFGWIDTCCIDKTSSAELDEAIRSMYRWYRNSGICIIHLSDTTQNTWPSGDSDPWFSRGWTLQELLAPQRIKFYDSNWKELTQTENDKSNKDIASVIRSSDKVISEFYQGKSIVDWISVITKIPPYELLNFKPGLDNIGERLSWASNRSTTRVEDMAYCLLGIFDITMPIAYGEGGKAVHRLQEAIVERSNDRSIFQWNGDPSPSSSMLANNLSSFGSVRGKFQSIARDTLKSSTHSFPDPAFTLTNHGLRIVVSLYSKELSSVWLKARFADPRYNFVDEKVKLENDKTSQQAFRLAILGYTAGKPVFLHLHQKHIRGHLYYVRSRSYDLNEDYGLATEDAKPEIIYIR